ncbi:MAG: outer membrane lipoprotein-sorting protein [Armatimonadetes bacterium]|nr:outer membrane lipoprotein-sorting protein [Armatimonadota bacterium]
MSILTTLAATSLILTPQSQDIKNYVQSGFRDAQFTVKTGAHSISELSKINKDFTNSYRVSSSQVWLKEPFKLRMVSTIQGEAVTFIVNGGIKWTRVPRSNLNVKMDVSKKPGMRQTGFDFGLLTPAMLTTLFQADFVRMDRATGDAVFDLTYYASLKDTSRYRIWIDPEQKRITKKEWYAQKGRQGGRLMATIFYEKPVTQNGATLATQVSVNNADNKRAGTVSYENVKINAGVADDLFKVN